MLGLLTPWWRFSSCARLPGLCVHWVLPGLHPRPLPRQTADFAPEHPLRALLLRVGVESLLRFPLHAGADLLATLLLLDLPELNQIDETENIVRHLSPVMVLALKNALAHERIEEQTRGLERRVAERTIHTRSEATRSKTIRLTTIGATSSTCATR